MRQYETGFLISPDLSDEETEDLILQMAKVVSKKKGKMIKKDKWGKRKLAYPINKFEEAFYVFFYYEGEADIPSELERRFKQTDTILRYLTIKIDTRENVMNRRKKAGAREEGESEPKEKSSEELEFKEPEIPSEEVKEEEK
ncbi:MAG: 30S ribosomal protein S6 [Candidatus Aminicenantaceae bacterium]